MNMAKLSYFGTFVNKVLPYDSILFLFDDFYLNDIVENNLLGEKSFSFDEGSEFTYFDAFLLLIDFFYDSC